MKGVLVSVFVLVAALETSASTSAKPSCDPRWKVAMLLARLRPTMSRSSAATMLMGWEPESCR